MAEKMAVGDKGDVQGGETKALDDNGDAQSEATGGPQKCGGVFLKYFNGPEEAAKNIPEVQVLFKVRRLSDFDSKRGSFYADFLLMLDWEDPSLEIAEDKAQPDFVSGCDAT